MKKFFVISLILALIGCAVGEDYVRPKIDLSVIWKETPAISKTYDKTEIDKQWWKNFDDATLNMLITDALAKNLDVKIALANIKQARAERAGVIASQLPEIDVNTNAARTKNSQNVLSQFGSKPYNAFNLGFDASWEADIFGGRRAIEAANATLEVSQENAHDVEVTLLGDVASQYIAVRNYQNQIKIAEANLLSGSNTLELTKSRQKAGLVSDIDVVQAETLMQTTESNIPNLRSAMRSSIHSLEILLAEQPSALDATLAATQPIPISEHSILIGTPASILRNRPDIREAERGIAAATAVKDVAIAEMYPKISLTGMLGLESSQTSNLLNSTSRTWSLGAGALLPIIDFGRIRSDINIADAKQEQVFLNYQKTVLNALKEVENALVTYEQEKNRLESLTESVKAQEINTHLSLERYKNGGLVSFLTVLTAQQALYSAQITQAESRAALSTDLVVLYKALGGGWQK